MYSVQIISIFNRFILLIALLHLCQLAAAHNEYFKYQDEDKWANEFPQCGGKRQSPVNIETDNLIDFNGELMTFENFTKLPVAMDLTNTGHTIKLTYKWNGIPPSIRGGKLSGKYLFDSIDALCRMKE